MVIERLFEGKPQNHWVTLWHLKYKKTFWFQDVDKMLEMAEEFTDDIYYGIGSSSERKDEWHRMQAADVIGMGGIHVDIDFGPEGHKKQNLPPDINKAIEIANGIITPTFIVNSGHGLHAYYLFDSYQTSDIAWIANIQKTFQYATNAMTEYQVDMTHDVSRVLRVPGSYNCKEDQPVLSAVIVDNENIRYSPKHLSEIADRACGKYNQQKTFDFDSQKPLESDRVVSNGVDGKELLYNKSMTDEEKYRFLTSQLILTPKRTLDSEKFVEISEIFSHFAPLFYHGKELPNDNNSCSGYDLALANICATIDLSPQEICDLLIMHREYHHAEQMKFAHPYYYGKTIYMAMLEAEKKVIRKEHEKYEKKKIAQMYANENEGEAPQVDAQDSTDNKKHAADPEDLTPEAPKTNLSTNGDTDQSIPKVVGAQKIARQLIGNALGTNIHEIIKYPGDPYPVFYVTLKPHGREIKLGTFKEGVANQVNFTTTIQAELMGTSMTILKKIKKNDWADVVASLITLVREKRVSEDMFAVGKIRMWMRDFFKSTKVYDSIKEFLEDGDYSYCIHEGDDIYMNEQSFIGWLKAHRINEMRLPEIKIAIMQAGGNVDVLTTTGGDRVFMWKFSSDILN